MSGKVRFVCEGCRYSAWVADGHHTSLLVYTETRVCESCRSVVDVPAGLTSHVRRQRETAEMRTELGRCPACGSPETAPWPDGHPCPRCGGEMSTLEPETAHLH